MKARRFGKRAAALTVALVAMLIVGSVAYAWFSSNGSGSGSASVGTAADNITVTGMAAGALYPGGTTTVS